jgi:hypothetical protein
LLRALNHNKNKSVRVSIFISSPPTTKHTA